MVRGAWEDMVGRTIVGVAKAEMPWGNVAYLCFSDATCFEVFPGAGGIQGSSRIRYGSVRQIRELLIRQRAPFEIGTEPGPPLDPRDVCDGPDYIGHPDPEVVKMDGDVGGGNDRDGAMP